MAGRSAMAPGDCARAVLLTGLQFVPSASNLTGPLRISRRRAPGDDTPGGPRRGPIRASRWSDSDRPPIDRAAGARDLPRLGCGWRGIAIR